MFSNLSLRSKCCCWFLALIAVKQSCVAPVAAQDPVGLKERARALAKQGDYANAIKAYDAAVAAATKVYGAGDQRTDIVVNELAITHYQQGNYSEVEPLYQRVLKNTESRPGHDPGEVATCLNNLGALYDQMGEYKRAEETYLRSLSVRESSVGKNHPDLATNYHNLGTVARNQGETAKAIDLFRQSLQLHQRMSPPDETLMANTLNALAEAFESLGQSEQAEPLYLQSVKLREAKLGANHPTLAITLNNLAGLYKQQKKFAQAEQLYQRSLKIRQEKLGADHPSTATAIGNLGSLYREQGRYEDAVKLSQQTLTIREAKLGQDHPSVASTLNNLAGLWMDLDQVEKSGPLYERSIQILEKKNGPEHPDVALAYNNRAFLHAKQGNSAAASDDFERSRRIVRRHVSQILPALTESEQLTFLKVTDEARLHAALSLALQKKDDQAIVDRSAAWVLNSKGIAQQAVAQRMLANLDLNDPKFGSTARKLQSIRRELSRLTGTSPKGDEATRAKRIEKLREQEQELSAELAKLSGRPLQADRWVELADVRGAIPAKTVLVEIARFRRRDFSAKHADPKKWQSPHYAAWIIPATDEGPVRLVDLGDAEVVENAVGATRAALVSAAELIRSDGEPDAELHLKQLMAELTKLVLSPILAHTGQTDAIVLSPDAALWVIPWSALPLADQSYAIEKYNLTYVVSGRDVIRHDAAAKLNAPVVLADPDYDLSVAEAIASIQTWIRSHPLLRSIAKVRPSITLPAVPRLPGTAAEAQAIVPKLEAYSGQTAEKHLAKGALETVVKSIRQPQVLVLSTHGFFREDEVNNDDGEVAGRSKVPENPLLRCGLLFAGCNTRELAGVPNADDGVLTGLEVTAIDLRGTELVVLSACETGLGEVRVGEGVAGLRQAFQLAGARSVMATLWEIPDVQTARLMSDFFTQLSDSKNPAKALRQAQLTMIESRRDRNAAAHPFFWAAVTLTGMP